MNRIVCWFRGHLWDSDRPVGPLYAPRDICWRCNAERNTP